MSNKRASPMSVSVAFTKVVFPPRDEKVPAACSCRRPGHIIARSSQAINGTATDSKSGGGPLRALSRLEPCGDRGPKGLGPREPRGRASGRAVGDDDDRHAELRALLQAALGLRGLAEPPREADL